MRSLILKTRTSTVDKNCISMEMCITHTSTIVLLCNYCSQWSVPALQHMFTLPPFFSPLHIYLYLSQHVSKANIRFFKNKLLICNTLRCGMTATHMKLCIILKLHTVFIKDPNSQRMKNQCLCLESTRIQYGQNSTYEERE